MADLTIPAGGLTAHTDLVAGTVSTITFTDDLPSVEIVVRAGTTDIWYTLDGSTPVQGGSSTFVIPGGLLGADERSPTTAGHTIIKILSTATASISAQRGDG